MKKVIPGLVCAGIMCFSAVLSAAGLATIDFNYINDLIGDRASGMGGAYTAVSDDPSGAYYNPAGLVFAMDNQISLSVNSFKGKKITMENVVFGGSYNQSISTFYPSFFGVVQSLGKLKVSLTVTSINNEILDQDDFYRDPDDPEGFFNINYNITDRTTLYGISAAGFLSDKLSVGLAISGHFRRNEQIANQMRVYTDGLDILYQSSSMYITEKVYGMNFRAGMQWMPKRSLSLGLSAAYTLLFSHHLDFQRFVKEGTDGADFNDAEFVAVGFTINSKMPVEVRVGGAYFVNRRLLLAADIIGHLGNQYYQNEVKTTINGAVGAEYYLTPSTPMRFGFFTNRANTPALNPALFNQEMHVNLYGISSSFSRQTRNSSITLSGVYQFGRGVAQPAGSGSNDTSVSSITVSLTGSARY